METKSNPDDRVNWVAVQSLAAAEEYPDDQASNLRRMVAENKAVMASEEEDSAERMER